LVVGAARRMLADFELAVTVVAGADAGEAEPLGPLVSEALRRAQRYAAHDPNSFGPGDPARRARYLAEVAARAIDAPVPASDGRVERLTDTEIATRLDAGQRVAAHLRRAHRAVDGHDVRRLRHGGGANHRAYAAGDGLSVQLTQRRTASARAAEELHQRLHDPQGTAPPGHNPRHPFEAHDPFDEATDRAHPNGSGPADRSGPRRAAEHR
jgi:hypothetical protein